MANKDAQTLLPFAHAPARIRGLAVPAFFPASGNITSLIFGEAPGPRGADRSHIPFWGDGAGLPLYRALSRAGCAKIPETAWKPWDGARFVQEGLRPDISGIGLSNAFPSCPSDDGAKFRAPSRGELSAPENTLRLGTEIDTARGRGLLRIITLGRCARLTLEPLAAARNVPLVALPHPSAQGLLSEAPNRGKGARLADLQAAWEERLAALLR
jgi:uracil-DNA glycosylase